MIRPVNYILEFEPDLDAFTFSGTCTLEAVADRPTRRISVHAADLDIRSCTILYNGGVYEPEVSLDAASEQLVIILNRTINGRFVICTSFEGVLNDRLLGFYRSRYEQDGKVRHLATTQFEAADARRAFPCIDEPGYKATFAISITAPAGHMAVSNMPVRTRQRRAGKIRYTFETTPAMSTYLVYLGVGEFEYMSTRTKNTQIRLITTRGNKSRGRFSLGLAQKLLAAYEEYFGIPYPLPKLDLLAIPDFAAGAMENWGAITFRESILLYDPATSSTRTRQFIAEVVSHEIAHQWFGNLVTMKWWNDLWLNESFATFMATKFTDKMYPKWDLWDQFIEDTMNNAMSLDALKSTHPIDVAVRSPAEIREIFDAISYDKGGCVLRMLEHYVGEPAFRRGLRDYLRRFRYANATGDDLWDAIGKSSGRPVKKMVRDWLQQPGFPLLDISQRGSTIYLRQKRFMLEPGSKSRRTWHIPVEISAGKRHHSRLLGSASGQMKIPGGRPIMANKGRHGFYRTRYDSGLMLDLKMLADQKDMPHTDRWAVQNDLFALCMSGDLPVGQYLDFIDAYFDEDNYLVLSNVSSNLYSLFIITFPDTPGIIRQYASRYVAGMLGRLGWDPQRGRRHTDALLRSFAVSALTKMGDSGVASEARRRYLRFLDDPASLSPDLAEAVLSTVAWNGGPSVHSRLVGLYKKAPTQEEKMRHLAALSSFQDPRLLLKTLDFSQTRHVRSQNMHLPIMRIAANPHGRDILWPWLQKNWSGLGTKVGHGNPLFGRIVASIGNVAGPEMEAQIRLFFRRNPVPGTERTLEQTLERVRIRSKFRARIHKEFAGA